MARVHAMSWDGHPNYRWVKDYKGVRYRVSCEELSRLFPNARLFYAPTKEGSYRAANEWWKRKRAELDKPPRDIRREILEGFELADIQQKIADLNRLLEAKKAVAIVEDWDEEVFPPEDKNELLEGDIPLSGLVETAERLEAKPVSPPDRSLGKLGESYLETKASKLRAGKLSVGYFGMQRIYLNLFLDWAGKGSAVDCLDEQKCQEFYDWLARQFAAGKWSVAYVKQIWATAQNFVRYCYKWRLIELPRNLEDLSFTVPAKTIQTFTVEEIRTLLDNVAGQSELHVLLMLNCGMLGMDIATLRQTEVDWEQGIITRKRTKTKGHSNVPVVRYKLWPETFTLLKKWRSQHPELVLLTKSGKPWIVEKIKPTGELSRSDKIKRNLGELLKKLGIKRSPKQLRKTPASWLDRNPQYARYAVYFLGQSPRTIADRHYIQPSDQQFWEALEWLHDELLGNQAP